jgi:hypothetical protein
MNRTDKINILRGEVFHEGRWVPIDRKVEAEIQRRKKIEAGYVLYHGEWITIDEKLGRVTPQKTPEKKHPDTVVVNINDNRTVYNVDNRTVHEHQHRHLHIDKNMVNEYVNRQLTDNNGTTTQQLSGNRDQKAALPDREKHKPIRDKRKIKGLLMGPDEDS